jgi:hypothetical protein
MLPWTHTNQATLLRAIWNTMPGAVLNIQHPALRVSQAKLKPVAVKMSSDEDIVVLVLWKWLLSADARSKKRKFWMQPLKQKSSHIAILSHSYRRFDSMKTKSATLHMTPASFDYLVELVRWSIRK